MERLKRHAISAIVLLLISGCATGGKSTLLGAGSGAALGAGIGALANPGPKGEGRIRNVFIGAAAGSLIGAGVGYLAHEGMENREKEAFERGKKEGTRSEATASAASEVAGAPVLLPPRIESRFVDEQIRGSVYIPAHFEYVIVEPARWSR